MLPPRTAISALLALAACSSTSAPGPAATSANVSCSALPDAPPPDLVIRVTRSKLPMGPEKPSQETGAIAASAAECSAQDHCVAVARELLASCYTRARASLAVRHAGGASPHYGGRFIEIHAGGATCTASDVSTSVVTERDMPTFDAAFDAITNAYAVRSP